MFLFERLTCQTNSQNNMERHIQLNEE